MTTTSLALSVPCPDCNVKKDEPCVYIEPTAPEGTSAFWAQNARAGLPTKRPHTGRFTRAYFADRDAGRKARSREEAARRALTPDRAAILGANAQAVIDEQQQLIAWLRQHASILEGAS